VKCATLASIRKKKDRLPRPGAGLSARTGHGGTNAKSRSSVPHGKEGEEKKKTNRGESPMKTKKRTKVQCRRSTLPGEEGTQGLMKSKVFLLRSSKKGGIKNLDRLPAGRGGYSGQPRYAKGGGKNKKKATNKLSIKKNGREN